MGSRRPARKTAIRVRLGSFTRSSLGFVALIATLALSSPGVRIARAADDDSATVSIDPVLVKAASATAVKDAAPPPPASPGPVACSDTTAPSPLNDALVQYQTQRMLRQLAQRLAESAPARDPNPEDGIVLNPHGYNYPSGPHR